MCFIDGTIEFYRADNHKPIKIEVRKIGYIKIDNLKQVVIVMEDGMQIPVEGSVEWISHKLKSFVRSKNDGNKTFMA